MAGDAHREREAREEVADLPLTARAREEVADLPLTTREEVADLSWTADAPHVGRGDLPR
jgi:hypothetical protein